MLGLVRGFKLTAYLRAAAAAEIPDDAVAKRARVVGGLPVNVVEVCEVLLQHVVDDPGEEALRCAVAGGEARPGLVPGGWIRDVDDLEELD